MNGKLVKFFHKALVYRDSLFISTVILVFILFRIPSLIEPYWYGDEGIYQVIGQAMREGRILYSEIWDNKPPLLYVIYALFNGDLFYVRLASAVSGVLSIIFFFLLAKKLFKSRASIFISATFYSILFGLPVLEGNIANSENFMHLPIIAAFYLIVASQNKNRFLLTAVSGVLLSAAFLIKIVAIFDLAALIISIFMLRFYEDMTLNGENIRAQIKNIVISIEQETLLIIAFIFPIIITALYFVFLQAFPDFYKAALSQNVGYVGHGNYFIFPMGFLFLKIALLLFASFLIARYRKILGPAGILILVWVAFSLFNALFSQRPYTHYLLVLLPSFSLFLGYISDNKRLLKLTIPILFILAVLILQNFRFNFNKALFYYFNYSFFIMGVKSVTNYQAFFDRNTPNDYEIARFITAKTAKHEEVFLWSDSAQIYALSGKLPPGRYIVSYHITFYKDAIEETKKIIDEKKPKYIIQTKDHAAINHFLDEYDLKYKLAGDVKVYER